MPRVLCVPWEILCGPTEVCSIVRSRQDSDPSGEMIWVKRVIELLSALIFRRPFLVVGLTVTENDNTKLRGYNTRKAECAAPLCGGTPAVNKFWVMLLQLLMPLDVISSRSDSWSRSSAVSVEFLVPFRGVEISFTRIREEVMAHGL